MKDLDLQMQSLTDGETDLVANLSNASALIYQSFDRINWAGFYRVQGNQLVLGPFQGKPACLRIAFGKGVCGSAWKEDRSLVVPDVHLFPGHIACDAASRSEIVIPIHRSDRTVWGVLDIDSPIVQRFGTDEKIILEKTVSVLEKVIATGKLLSCE